jgi:hypothetical protein
MSGAKRVDLIRTTDVKGTYRWYREDENGKRKAIKDSEFELVLRQNKAAQREKTAKGSTVFFFVDSSGKK